MTRGTLPTGTVTFLFTDIEGSTPLWDAHPAEMGEALSRHDKILHEAITHRGGHVFSSMGDGFAAVFSRAGDAIGAGLAAQLALGSERWPESVELRVRMGLNTGEVQEREGDYFGPPVNRAARLMGAAHGGQVVASALTAELLDSSDDIDLVDLGSVALKGVVHPVHVFGVSTSGLEWLDRPLISTQQTAGNLPRLRTDSVGDLADMQRRVSRLANARLVTLTGSGGVGKTRAALEVGWLVVDEFVDGVWMVELGPIADVETVIAAIASTLSIQLQPGMTMIESIVDWCFGRRMLLILDNCEHVLDPISELVSAVMSSCSTVTVLATSREPLGVGGEQVIRIPSLDSDQSVEMFCDRAVAADSRFSPSPSDLEAIQAICDRVDGIPLAIELAAARTRSLSPVDLLARLDDRFRVLRGGGRGGMERHQTLRAAVTWSYQLLSETERILFDRLTVFAGTFGLEAAEDICAGGDVDEYDIVDLIGFLVDKSMVIAEHGDAGTRYRLLETLRQYGEERLDHRGETVQARDRHLAHYRGVAERAYDQSWGAEQTTADAVLDRDWDNLRAAHNWSITSEQLDAAEAMLFGTMMCAFNRLRFEHREWANRSMSLGEDLGSISAMTYAIASFWEFFASDAPRAIELARLGLERHPNDPRIGFCHAALLYGLMAAGRTAEVAEALPGLVELLADNPGLDAAHMLRMVLAEASASGLAADDHIASFVEHCHKIGSPMFIARCMMIQGSGRLSAEPPDLPGALSSFRETIRLGEIGSPAEVVWGHCGLAGCRVLDEHPEAGAVMREALNRGYDSRLWLAVDVNLEMCVRLLLDTSPDAAATILGHLELQPAAAFAVQVMVRRESLAAVAELADGQQWKANGVSMDRHEIVAYALSHLADG